MKTAIYYFTGTGNSLWAARKLGEYLGGTEIRPLSAFKPGESLPAGTDVLGLVFPVYIWGVPAPVIRFLDALGEPKPRRVFALAVNGGQAAGTIPEIAGLLRNRGMELEAGFGLTMPSNYIAWGGPGPEEKIRSLFEAAEIKLKRIAGAVRSGERSEPEKGPLWQRILLGAAHRMSFKHIPAMDKKFFADEKCDGCGICSRVCPVGNIGLPEGKPVWLHRCEQCFACIQWCPRKAIQGGKKTKTYERYHHPEVTLRDMLEAAKRPG